MKDKLKRWMTELHKESKRESRGEIPGFFAAKKRKLPLKNPADSKYFINPIDKWKELNTMVIVYQGNN